jgi:acyl-CoA synthetase (AMP-forming)/AMP-acid ligase II
MRPSLTLLSPTFQHPKGVLHSQLQWAQQSVAFKYNMYRAFIRTGMDVPVPPEGELPPQSCWFLPVPLFHLTGVAYTFGATLLGAKIIYVYKWNAEEGIDIIQKEQVTSESRRHQIPLKL